MNTEQLKAGMGKYMIDSLNAVDGDGNKFEFGKTYHFYDRLSMEIKSFTSRYSCLALQPGQVVTKGDEAWYCHVKNQQDFEFKIPVSQLHAEVKPAYEKALVHYPAVKQRRLDELQLEITSKLEHFKEMINDFDAKQEKLQAAYDKLK